MAPVAGMNAAPARRVEAPPAGRRLAREGVSIGLLPETSKRIMDVALCALMLPVLLPLTAVLAVWIRLDSPGPVFFSHPRYGRGGRRFRMLKFRTMRADAAEAVLDNLRPGQQHAWEWAAPAKTRDDPRITQAGRWLRRLSLDELPQIWNVMRGDMSLVGPRPVPVSERRVYGRGFAVYCRVRPGMTGLWQVSGRSDLTYAQRVALDGRYVRGRSIRGDLQLLWRTLGVVVRRRGAY